MTYCPLCNQRIVGPANVESEIRECLKGLGHSFVGLTYYGPFKVVLIYKRAEAGYFTAESVVDGAQPWTQDLLDARHIEQLKEGVET